MWMRLLRQDECVNAEFSVKVECVSVRGLPKWSVDQRYAEEPAKLSVFTKKKQMYSHDLKFIENNSEIKLMLNDPEKIMKTVMTVQNALNGGLWKVILKLLTCLHKPIKQQLFVETFREIPMVKLIRTVITIGLV